MEVAVNVSLDLALLGVGLLLLMHGLNRKLQPHCIGEVCRYIRLADRLRRCHAPLTNAYALADEFHASCAELAAHHRSYSFAAYCFRGWYSQCRKLERRCSVLFDAYVGTAGSPASVLKNFEDGED